MRVDAKDCIPTVRVVSTQRRRVEKEEGEGGKVRTAVDLRGGEERRGGGDDGEE